MSDLIKYETKNNSHDVTYLKNFFRIDYHSIMYASTAKREITLLHF